MPLNWTLKNGQKGKFYNKCGGGLVTKSCLTLATPWTIAHQAPLSMGFPRKEYCSRLPFLSPGDLPDSGVKPVFLVSPELAGKFFTTEPPWKPHIFWILIPYHIDDL